MFESLSEKIHQDEMKEASGSQRMLRYATIVLTAVGVIFALAAGVRFLG